MDQDLTEIPRLMRTIFYACISRQIRAHYQIKILLIQLILKKSSERRPNVTSSYDFLSFQQLGSNFIETKWSRILRKDICHKSQVQWTLFKMTAFVPIKFVVDLNLLL